MIFIFWGDMKNDMLTGDPQFRSPHVVDYKPPADVEIDANRFHCRLVVGECRQGIMTVEYKPATDVTKTIAEEFSTVRLKSAL